MCILSSLEIIWLGMKILNPWIKLFSYVSLTIGHTCFMAVWVAQSVVSRMGFNGLQPEHGLEP